MVVRKKDNQIEADAEEQNAKPEEASAANELRLPVWSVISFEKLEAGGLTYAQAEEKIRALEAGKVSGLCIVTDEVAARISENS